MNTYKQILSYAKEMRKNPTEAEKVFWSHIRNRRFIGLKFNRQFIIKYKEKLGEEYYYC